MEIYKYPTEKDFEKISQRNSMDFTTLFSIVQKVADDVKSGGDEALKDYTERFDGVRVEHLEVTQEEFEEGERRVAEELKKAILTAKENIEKFHSSQFPQPQKIETTMGVTCWQRPMGIEKVGLYVPGGTAPLFSTVLMLGIPARIAGCREIILCTPPNKQGKVHPAVLYAARTAGVKRVFKVGGSQAIAAMAYGTETIPKMYKIFGPGNQYVAAAKQFVSLGNTAIDMPAGPSEVMVVADESAKPEYVVADFLSQAEHGADSQSILLTTSEEFLERSIQEIERQTSLLSREDYIRKSLEHSKVVLLHDRGEILSLINAYAPEHLIIQTKDYESYGEEYLHAGSVFLGAYTPESAGDYASGTNHTLPTHGFAHAYSGLNLDAFLRKVTFQHITQEGLRNLAPTIESMAEAEQLTAHKNAVSIRVQ